MVLGSSNDSLQNLCQKALFWCYNQVAFTNFALGTRPRITAIM